MSKNIEWKSSSFDEDKLNKLNELTHKSLIGKQNAKLLHSNPKFSEWTKKGGDSAINKMLKWCEDNNHWEKMSELQRGIPKSEDVKKKISQQSTDYKNLNRD